MVDEAELDAPEPDQVDLDAAGGEPVEEALDEALGVVPLEEGPVEQVDTDDAERLLLEGCLGIEHPDMQGDLVGLVTGMGLELDPHPAVALVVPLEAAGHHGVGEGEERRAVAPGVTQAVEVELELVVQHRLQPGHGDIPVGGAVDGVADGHVVGRHRLGDRPGGAAGPEEPAHHLLTGPDLGDGAVPTGVEVDAQGLLVGIGTELTRHATILSSRGCRRRLTQSCGGLRSDPRARHR